MNAPEGLGTLLGVPFSPRSSTGARSPRRGPARPKSTRVMRDRKPALEWGGPTLEGVLGGPSTERDPQTPWEPPTPGCSESPVRGGGSPGTPRGPPNLGSSGPPE